MPPAERLDGHASSRRLAIDVLRKSFCFFHLMGNFFMGFFNNRIFLGAASVALACSLVACGSSQQSQIKCNSVPENSTSEFRGEPYETLRYRNLSVDDKDDSGEEVQGGGAITRAAEKLQANPENPNLVLNLSRNRNPDMRDLRDSKELFGVESPASIIGEDILNSKGVPEDARVVVITPEEKLFCMRVMHVGGNSGH